MDFTVSSSELYKHMANASRIIASKPIMPILDYLLFTVSEGKITLVSTDTEMTVVTTFEPEVVRSEGSIAMPARLLLETLKEFPDMPLHFTADMEKLRIRVDYNTGDQEGDFSMQCQDASEFPEVPELREDQTVKIDTTADVLISGISHTHFAASTNTMSPQFCGVYLEAKPEHLRFVATDLGRLACYTRTDVQCDGEHSVLMPNRAASLLSFILSQNDEELSIAFDNRNLEISTAMYRLICRLTEGEFPDYETVIPRDQPNELVVDRVLLLNALRQVSPFSNRGHNTVTLEIRPDELTLFAQNNETSNSARQKMNCRFSGEPLTVHFNTPFLTEGLPIIASQEVMISFSAGNQGASSIMKPTINEGDEVDMFMVIMQSLNPL